MRGSCSCVSQGKSACLVVCLAQRFGLACPHSLRDATNCCATHYVGASSTSHNHIKYECLCGFCSWSSLKMVGVHHFLNALVQLPATYYVRIKKAKTRAIRFVFCFLVEMRGVVGASARCNSEMSVLAQANERQPGPGVQVGSFAHNTRGVSRIADKRKNGLVCPFCPFGGDAGS